jgi:hypothetical protein
MSYDFVDFPFVLCVAVLNAIIEAEAFCLSQPVITSLISNTAYSNTNVFRENLPSSCSSKREAEPRISVHTNTDANNTKPLWGHHLSSHDWHSATERDNRHILIAKVKEGGLTE